MGLILLHAAYIFLTFLQVPLNSDHANQVLQAADILKGNILLKGWNLTGVSFYLSELPFYDFGTALRGVDTWAYLIAASLMVICLSLLGFLLSFNNHQRNGLEKALIYLTLTGFPTITWLGYLRGHCAIFIYLCLLLLIIERIFRETGESSKQERSKSNTSQEIHNSGKTSAALWGVLGLLTAFGCMSDMQLLIIGILPILLFCGINLLQNEPRFDVRKTLLMSGVTICGTVLGVLLDKLLMVFGSINKNSFLDTRKFADLDALGVKAKLLWKGILNVFRTDITQNGWHIRDIIAFSAAIIIISLTVYLLISTLLRFVRKGDGDPVSVTLSFSIAVMCTLCFFTDIYTAEDSARYISYLPFAAGILICRDLDRRLYEPDEENKEKLPDKRIRNEHNSSSRAPFGQNTGQFPKFRMLFCLMGFLIAGLGSFVPPVFLPPETPQDRLAAILEENDLRDGYADFWNASHTTVASKGNVRVRAIRGQVPELGKPDYMEMQNWFCKTDWYRERPHNFIVFDGLGSLHVSEDLVLALLGEPGRIIDTDEYRIYIYDRDLNQEIVIK